MLLYLEPSSIIVFFSRADVRGPLPFIRATTLLIGSQHSPERAVAHAGYLWVVILKETIAQPEATRQEFTPGLQVIPEVYNHASTMYRLPHRKPRTAHVLNLL